MKTEREKAKALIGYVCDKYLFASEKKSKEQISEDIAESITHLLEDIAFPAYTLRPEEERIVPPEHIKKESNSYKVLNGMYNCHELIDFVNWYLKYIGIDEDNCLENLEVIWSFLNGDDPLKHKQEKK